METSKEVPAFTFTGNDPEIWKPSADELKLSVGGITKMDGQILLEGKKKDEGKPRWELVAYDAVEGVAKVLTFGANKYTARNWEKGIAYGRVFGAIMRHMWKWWHGEDTDAETGLSHLDHAMCEIMFLSAYEKRGKNGTAQDDRPNSPAVLA